LKDKYKDKNYLLTNKKDYLLTNKKENELNNYSILNISPFLYIKINQYDERKNYPIINFAIKIL